MEAHRTVSILSIDAWADSDDGWVWNAWYKIGDCPLSDVPNTLAEMIKLLQSTGYVSDRLTDDQIDDLRFEDDQYNVTLCDADGRPLYAVAYGEAF